MPGGCPEVVALGAGGVLGASIVSYVLSKGESVAARLLVACAELGGG
jgi:hypothetical protein